MNSQQSEINLIKYKKKWKKVQEIFQTIVFDGTFGFLKKRIRKKTIYQDNFEAHTKFKL